MSRRSFRPSVRSRCAQSPIEALETRRLLAASLSAGGTLSVIGSNFYDNVVISRQSGDPSTLVVSEKRKNLAPVLTTFNFASVKSIVVQLNNGDDQFIIDETFGIITAPRDISGGEGNDLISGGRSGDTINGDNGNDTLSGRQGDDSVLGGAGNDVISGGTGDDTLHGNADNDTIYGDDADDSMTGGLGDDFLHGVDGDDSLEGNDGNDSLEGCTGDDILFGGNGNDVLDGLFGSDTLFGDDGNDILTGNFGNDGPDLPGDLDSITGGAGNDDFDPLDTVAEIKDRSAADNGDNGYVPTFPSVVAILNTRAFV